ncbi:hypothetical protein GCM10010412_004840 [Nonomuraea recticatena]|uniref:Protein kinase domain-containing protein n=1 Tax=Nonomuraea recticatena TaxID=46178 RepID=A0ABN3R506_9ACTN
MAPFNPLRSGDPARLGGYSLVGRLGEGGQGVVYLATDPAGAHVAIKWLRPGDAVSTERFLREVEVARRVAAFCTAQVLATGSELDRPYIVSEYIEGPTLQRVVQEQGPRSGPALHRLAIATATALAAIHQAGIVHRDFKPANVIIAPDGPRVIDFGIARALNATSTITSSPVGTPSFMAPEQLLGHQVGPAADMFTWACTIAYAASGRPPFGSDTMPAVINRVLNAPPDVSELDEPLREVVHACLSKDPSLRPTAEQAIMRLLRQQPGHHGAPQGPFHAPEFRSTIHPPPRRKRTGLVVGLSAGAAALLVVVAAVVVPWGRLVDLAADSPTVRTGERTPSPTKSARITPSPTASPSRQRLLGTQATVYERPGDPIRLTSYEVYDKKAKEWVNYARKGLTGSFSRYEDNWETLLSPDGRLLAERGKDYTSDKYDAIFITDKRTGRKTTVKTVKEPLISSIRAWSNDGSKILLNIERSKGDEWLYPGFAIVDVATGKLAMADVPGTTENSFGWDGRGEGVVNQYGSDLRFFDASGRRLRDVRDIGDLPAGTLDIFSPSGASFATECPDGELCVWDSRTGERLRMISTSCDKLLGWYDETHLYCWELDNAAKDRIEVIDFTGKEIRTLVDIPDGVGYSPTFTRTP